LNTEITRATPQDVPLILQFIAELAEYEKLTHLLSATEAQLHEHLFGARPYAEVLMLHDAGQPAGFALYFHNYSTFLAKPGLYLEDLFVRPAFRGRGHGKRLMIELAKIAVERGCGRFEWSVLDWNAPSIAFYRSLGAVGLDEWTVQRVTGQALIDLAAR
jgi:GNAT superfamily N-acetyltransferase